MSKRIKSELHAKATTELSQAVASELETPDPKNPVDVIKNYTLAKINKSKEVEVNDGNTTENS